MRITARLRTLDTPQTDRNGNPLKGRNGSPLYTQYVQCSDMKQIQMKEHMRKELTKLAKAIEELGEPMFEAGCGVSLHTKFRNNEEPKPYSYLDRLEMVYKRSLDPKKQVTMGIIDMFNSVIKDTYKGLGCDLAEISERSIIIDDIDEAAVKHQVFTALFKYGKDLD